MNVQSGLQVERNSRKKESYSIGYGFYKIIVDRFFLFCFFLSHGGNIETKCGGALVSSVQ